LNLQNKRLVLAVDDLDELPDEAKAAIAKLKERVNGDGSISIEVELHDKLVALDRLGKSIGFLVAEANADAAEAAKRIIADSESTNAVERALLLSIRDNRCALYPLARGAEESGAANLGFGGALYLLGPPERCSGCSILLIKM
jgi:hypothetical protein